MSTLNTDRMTQALLDAGVKLKVEKDWTAEEVYNYIIHQFCITFCVTNYADLQDIARCVYSQRKFRGQKWTNAYKP